VPAAAGLGWDAMALFGCAPKRPLDYSGSAGLLWAINGGRLVELHRDWPVIDLPVNRSQRVFDRRKVDPAKISPTFQIAFFETTFASSSPTCPAKSQILRNYFYYRPRIALRWPTVLAQTLIAGNPIPLLCGSSCWGRL
jgi:hypothetical protein